MKRLFKDITKEYEQERIERLKKMYIHILNGGKIESVKRGPEGAFYWIVVDDTLYSVSGSFIDE